MMEKNVNDIYDEIEIDLLEIGRVVWKKWWFLCMGMLIGVLLSGIYTWKLSKPIYEASAMIYMRGSGNTIASLQDLQIGAALTDDYEVIFLSRPILEEVVEELELDITYKELREEITLSNPTDTRILKVVVRNENPVLAADIVNTLVMESMDCVKEIDAKEPYLIEDAVVDMTPVSATPLKVILIGAMAGLILTMGVVIIHFLLNDRVSSVEAAEKLLGIPVLCVVPDSKSCNYDELVRSRHKGKRE